MRGGAIGLSTVLLWACTPTPAEVVEVFDGDSSSGSATTNVTATGQVTVTSTDTGPVAEGSADSGTGPGSTGPVLDGTSTGPVDPSTTGEPPGGSTDSGSTGNPVGGSSSSGDPPQPSCDEVFGMASGYFLCNSDDSSCSFNVSTGGNSCNTICGSFGETCLGAQDNPGAGGDVCFVQGPYDCASTSKSTTICICSRPP